MIHQGSLDTYETLSSGRDGLERFRILHDFGQYILNGVKGDILEIGVGESSYYLSQIAKKFNRLIYHCDISASKITNPMSVKGYLSDLEEITYFEERDPTPEQFRRVVCFAGPSDDLFKRVPIGVLALAFIDGDHKYDQVKRDYINCFSRLADGGFVLLHDTCPPDENWMDENHCGDVWALRREIECENTDILTLPSGCVIGVGLTIIRKRPHNRKSYQ